jgi:hypothetical protein
LSKLTTEHADKIANKLVGPPEGGRKHEHVYVKWRGRIVASYGIRRSSHQVGHDFIPRQIFVTTHQAIDLARCPLSREDYFAILQLHGHLPKMKCELCATEDFDREVSIRTQTYKRKSHKLTLCADCDRKAEGNDQAAWAALETVLRAQGKI